MAVATMTALSAILKEVYEGRIESQLQNEVVAAKRIERSSDGVVETVGGKYVDFPIRVGRNAGIGNRLENEALPTAGSQAYAAPHIPLTYCYGRVRLTGQLIELAEKNFQSFASALDSEMEGVKDDAAKDYNRQLYGNGTGLLASVTADGVNTVTVDNIQYLEVGSFVDIRTRSTGAAIAVQRNITAINETTRVVTYDGADVAATANEGLYREGNFAAGTSRELSGFDLIISDTLVLHGIDPAVQPKWKASVINNPAGAGTLRALSEGIMIAAADTVRVKGGGKPTVIFTGLGVRRAYFNLLTQQRRYTDTKNFEGGFQGLAFNYGTEIPVVEDVDCKPNTMKFVNEKALKIYRNRSWHWGDTDGTILKWVSGFDAWEGFMKQYSEFGTSHRNAHAALNDLIEG
jgi:hypothetical protein